MTEDEVFVEQLKTDWQQADMDAANRAMLAYAVKLTQKPAEMKESDVITLREAGFTDAAILDINQVTAYYAYVNRLADGLGVELEDIGEQ